MTAFRLFLVAVLVVICGYTAVVVANHGLGLLGIFFRDMAAMGWPGQFNLDFMFMLGFSGLWVVWRHRFSPAGWLLGGLAFFGGSLFLSTYLLVLSLQTGGDVRRMLLGGSRGWN